MKVDNLTRATERKRKQPVLWRLLALACLLMATAAWGGIPVISGIQVTDVTPRSFSVIMHSNEPVTMGGGVFNNCSTAVAGATITFANSSTSGNIRVSISGLNSATPYCYKPLANSISTGEPASLPDIPSTTASAVINTILVNGNIIPFANDLARLPDPFLAPGETQSGLLVTLDLANGRGLAPLSLLLSNNSSTNYFNLNNLFDKTSGQSLNLIGGERVKVTERHGATGCGIERFRMVAADGESTAARSLVRANTSDIDASGGVNILDVLRLVGGKGTTGSGQCFNSDLDLDGNGVIDTNDLNIVKGSFNGL